MFVGPKEIKKYLTIGGKDDIPAKLMDLKDVASTQLHPNTKENDGNWRYNITPNEEKWTIFPIHCDIDSIETTLGKYKFFSHSKLRLKGKKKKVNDENDDDLYLTLTKNLHFHSTKKVLIDAFLHQKPNVKSSDIEKLSG